jgi:hypothetical protein
MFNSVSEERIAFMFRVEYPGNTEDGCSTFLRNGGTQNPDYIVTHHRKAQSLQAPPAELQISQIN